jgi:hypothetical protein
MQQHTEQKVMDVAKHQWDVLFEQSGVRPSLEEVDMKEYLKQVLVEVKRDKNVAIGR